jgi:hypothetical protein
MGMNPTILKKKYHGDRSNQIRGKYEDEHFSIKLFREFLLHQINIDDDKRGDQFFSCWTFHET